MPLTTYQAFLNASLATIESLRGLESELLRAVEVVSDCLNAGNKMLVCGNGGSAADAMHLATEFVCRFEKDRRSFPAIALPGEGSLLTAIGNDYGFDQVFARQIEGLGQEGDVVIVFTTSGKSPNILRALETARERKLQSIAFLGKDGGPARGMATIDLIVPGTSTARIQEGHQVLLHALCALVEERVS